PARREDQLGEGLEEVALGDGVHVHRVGDPVPGQVLQEGLLEDRVVVPVVQGTGAREEVDVALAVLGPLVRAARGVEDDRPVPAVAAYLGLAGGEDLCVGVAHERGPSSVKSWGWRVGVAGQKGPMRCSTSGSWPSSGKCPARKRSISSCPAPRPRAKPEKSAREAVLSAVIVVSR